MCSAAPPRDASPSRDASPPAPALARTVFLPHRLLDKVMQDVKKARVKRRSKNYFCNRGLLSLQEDKAVPPSMKTVFYSWKVEYGEALRRATFAHDWETLLSLLRSSPVWEHYNKSRAEYHDIDNYFKAFTILLMNHPAAKRRGLLQDYLHMVLSCRSDEDKRALMKVLVALPEKLVNRNSFATN